MSTRRSGHRSTSCRRLLRSSRRSRRDGLSLLEVILAIAILGGALAFIGELVRIGSVAANRAENLSKAQIIADAKLAEVSVGALPMQSTAGVPVDEDPDWLYSVVISEADQYGLLYVEVVVEQDPSQYAVPLSIRLSRWITDPAFIDELEAAAEAEL